MKEKIHIGQAITVILTTVSNEEDARALSRGLIELQHVACVQTNPINSYYIWDGEIKEEKEIRLMIKVVEEKKIDTLQYLKEYHPYELPELTLTAFSSEKEYYEWCRAVSGI